MCDNHESDEKYQHGKSNSCTTFNYWVKKQSKKDYRYQVKLYGLMRRLRRSSLAGNVMTMGSKIMQIGWECGVASTCHVVEKVE